jgi:hypothetical protein
LFDKLPEISAMVRPIPVFEFAFAAYAFCSEARNCKSDEPVDLPRLAYARPAKAFAFFKRKIATSKPRYKPKSQFNNESGARAPSVERPDPPA